MDVPKKEAKRLHGVTWAPPRNQTTWPDWEEARSEENGEWRLEPEREAEVPDVIIVSDAVEGTFVDLEGESRWKQSSREEKERCSARTRRLEVRKGK